MKGTITIRADESGHLTVDCRMSRMSKLDALCILDGLAEAFDLDEEQRMKIGVILAVGGFKVITGKDPVAMRMDTSFLDLLNKKKENNNETVSEN